MVIKSGGDIVSSASKLSQRLGIPLKNWHLPGHKFTGPFTQLDKRLDESDNPLPGFSPFNQIDQIAMKQKRMRQRNVRQASCDGS